MRRVQSSAQSAILKAPVLFPTHLFNSGSEIGVLDHLEKCLTDVGTITFGWVCPAVVASLKNMPPFMEDED